MQSWLKEIDRARTEAEVVATTRDYLALWSPTELARFPEIVAMTKADLPDVREAYPQAQAEFAQIGVDLHLVSAASHDGLDALMQSLAEKLAV